MKKIIIAVLTFLFSLHSYADFSYNYFQIAHVSLDGNQLTAKGESLNVSIELNENLYILAGHESTDYNDVDRKTDLINFGIGAHFPVSGNTDFFGLIKCIKEDDGLSDRNMKQYGSHLGIRSKITKKIEIMITAIWAIQKTESTNATSDMGWDLSGAFDLTDSLQALVNVDDDSTAFGLRLNF